MAFSIIQTTATGSTNAFPINFTLGFNNRNEVTCQVNDEVDGLGDPVYRALDWVNDGLVNVLPATLIPAGQKVVFKRTVTKTALIHDYSNGEAIEEENLDESNKQNLMAIHELFDGRFTSAFQQDLDMGTHKIHNVVDGTDPQDAVTKAQLDVVETLATNNTAQTAADVLLTHADVVLTHADVVLTHADVVTTAADVVAANLAAAQAQAAANGMKYRSVRVATTANAAIATAYENGDTIDGVVLATGDRILLKNQTTQSQNGLYTVQASGAPVRTSDGDTWDELVGSVVIVQEGTVNADIAYICTANQGGTLGSTNVTYADWSAAILSNSIALSKIGTQPPNTMIGNFTGATNELTALSIAANQFIARGSAGNTGVKTITDDALALLAAAIAANTFYAKGSTGNYVAKTISDDALAFLAAANNAAMRTSLGVAAPVFTQVVDVSFGPLIGTASSLSHGLPGIPKMVYSFLRCNISDMNYPVGFELPLQADAGNNRMIGVGVNATNVNVGWGPAAYQVNDAATGNPGSINYGNWTLVVRCYY